MSSIRQGRSRRMIRRTTCPGCDAPAVEVFHEIHDVPANSVIVLESRDEALHYPRGDMVLSFCQVCGLIFNAALDPDLTKYSSRCEESQTCSPTFNAWHERLARRLTERYGLYRKDILEIGCGKGAFLNLLCELGENRGLGFDPAFDEARPGARSVPGVEFVSDFFGNAPAECEADLICCKMTLEHISAVGDFLRQVMVVARRRSGTVVFLQVPETTRILRECAFEDIYYEHCTYFSPGSLARLFRRTGFVVLDLYLEYDGQYLGIEASPTGDGALREFPAEQDLESLRGYVGSFPARCNRVIKRWQDRLEALHKAGRKAVLWGSGSKGVTFLGTVDLERRIEYVVDINPYRQGSYMAGSGQRVVAPEFLRTYRPDVVIVMNPIYLSEISRELHGMGLSPDLEPLGQ